MHRFLQLALDLFDTAPAPVSDQKPPLWQSPSAHKATDLVANAPQPNRIPDPKLGTATPVPLSGLLAPAHFAHPRANRELLLANSVVAFEFKRAKRKSIGFVIGPDGLVVSAPRWVSMADVDAAVHDKASWIVKKLGEVRERHQKQASARIVWQDGCQFPYLGQTITLVLDPTHGFKGVGGLLDETDGQKRLHIGLPHTATEVQIRDAAQAWLMRDAKRLFAERLNHYAPLLGVQWRKLSLSSAGTRWGSANTSGAIRLNWRLIHMRLGIIDYVVVHELSHLRVMDHSPRFWDTVATIVPDYAKLRGELKEGAVPAW
jgi:hypothetical protein